MEKEKTNQKILHPIKKKKNKNTSNTNSQNWKTNKINPSKIHCYSFPPEGEKNDIFQSCLWLVYILLQLTSTINPNLEAPVVTLSPCYRNVQISPKPHFWKIQHRKTKQTDFVLSTWSNPQQLSWPLQSFSPTHQEFLTLNLLLLSHQQLCYLQRSVSLTSNSSLHLDVCIQAWEGYSPRFLQERCVINIKAVSLRKLKTT